MYKFFFLVMSILSLDASLVAMNSSNTYRDELGSALAVTNSVLGRASQLRSGPALGLLRSAQWHNYLSATQNRSALWRDKMGYYFMENEIASFADRCYVLPPNELPLLYATAAQYAQMLGIMVPLLLLVDDSKLVDATGACWSSNTGFVILGRGLFEEMSEAEFCGVLAHQMAVVAARHQATMAKSFAPVFIAGLVAMLYSVSKLRGSDERISLRRGVACLGMLGFYGAIMGIYWGILARHCEYKADVLASTVSARNGLAMLEAFDRFYQENMGGDLAVVRDIVSNDLPYLLAQDEHRAEGFIEGMESLYAVARKENDAVGSSFFSTHRSLRLRKALFKKAIADQAVEPTPVP